jgi:deoxyribose-phosphate aldolase
MQATFRDLAKMIDHSLLHPTMTDEQVRSGCVISRKYGVASACVKPYSVPMAAEIFAGSDVLVCAVAGFPHGNNHTSIKIAEAELSIKEGAKEIDVVVNNGKVLGGAWKEVHAELKAVNDAVVSGGAILKVIFENDYLKNEHIERLCEICSDLRIAFVKTSSGYGFVKLASGDYNYKGATEEHLKLMRAKCPPSVQIKAAGGVRSLDDMLKVRSWGVTRIGATATEAILGEAIKRGYGPVPAHLLDNNAVSSKAAAPAGY